MNNFKPHILFLSAMALSFWSCKSGLKSYSGAFSGEIISETHIVPLKEDFNSDSVIQSLRWDRTSYIINDKSYKSTHYKNDEFVYSYTYDNLTKRMYDYSAGDEYITYRDSRNGSDDEIDFKIYRDSTIVILGRKAYKTHERSDSWEADIYYSDAVRINYQSFKDHKVGNWYQRLEKTNGAISLKTVEDHGDYLEIREAVKINIRNLTEEDFSLPKNIPIAASYSAVDETATINQPTGEQINCIKLHLLTTPDIKEGEVPFTSYISFFLSSEGEVKYPNPLEKDEYGLSDIAIDILNSCKLEFAPAKINGETVNSEVILPVNFTI